MEAIEANEIVKWMERVEVVYKRTKGKQAGQAGTFASYIPSMKVRVISWCRMTRGDVPK